MRHSLAALVAVSAALAGCQARGEEGPGATVSRNYQIGNFHEIEVAGPYDVDVRTGTNASVAARGSEKLLEHTVVEVKGDKLVIRPERQHSWLGTPWHNNGKASFTVTVPQLSGATIAGSGDIRIDKVSGPEFEGTVAGSGGLNVGALDVQRLKLAIAGSGGAKAAAGQARSANYEIAGSGGVDAAKVATQAVDISIAGSGNVRAHASGTAKVSIMGSGNVVVAGGAKCDVSKVGSGNVRCS